MSAAGAEWEGGDPPLRGVRVLTLAVNLPGPAAASRLCAMGASVIKVEPPGGPLMCPSYYRDLSAGQEVVRLDLKDQKDRASLDDTLEGMDLLLTANRPAALGRLGLSWPDLHADFPRLCQVAIVGYPHPNEDAPGHDLTYRAREGHVALGALEPHFWERLLQELGVEGDRQDLGSIFETKTAEQWEEWAADRDLPLAAVRDLEQNEVDETASSSQRRRTPTRGGRMMSETSQFGLQVMCIGRGMSTATILERI